MAEINQKGGGMNFKKMWNTLFLFALVNALFVYITFHMGNDNESTGWKAYFVGLTGLFSLTFSVLGLIGFLGSSVPVALALIKKKDLNLIKDRITILIFFGVILSMGLCFAAYFWISYNTFVQK